MSDSRWFSVSEIADRLGVGKDRIYIWIETRHFPAHHIGKSWKFKIVEVDAWMRSEQSGDEY